MAQTVVNEFQDKWQKGMVGTSHYVRDTTAISEVAGEVEFGELLLIGSSDPEEGAVRPAAAFAQNRIKGIVMAPVSGGVQKRYSDGAIFFEQGDSMTLVQEGDIAVLLDDNVSAFDNVFYVHTAGGASAQYTYRNDLDTDKASQIPAQFLEAGSPGDIVLIRFNTDAFLGS